MSKIITPQELINIAETDLRRLSKKHDISVSPKTFPDLVVWRQNIRLCNYTSFKDDYMYAEDALRRWMDGQRWLQGIDFSMRWLSVKVFQESDQSFLQWQVREPYENFGS